MDAGITQKTLISSYLADWPVIHIKSGGEILSFVTNFLGLSVCSHLPSPGMAEPILKEGDQDFSNLVESQGLYIQRQ